MNTLLEVKGVSKSFPGVKALQNVDFKVNAGEVVALIGANGAGKSTLLKIVTGVYKRDEGDVILYGQQVNFSSPSEGKENGIACIYQELAIVPNLNVCENIFLSQIKKKKIINYADYYRRADEILRDLGVTFSARDNAGALSIANQQMIEVARAISENAKILIMDEPTSSLTTKEKDTLFNIVRKLRDKGLGIVFVGHRLAEVFEISERCTIMKDGQLVGDYPIEALTEKKMIALMTGKSLESIFHEHESVIGEVALKVEHLKRGNKIKDVSFEVRQGEILGLTGLIGAGRTEIARCIFGVDRFDSGTITCGGTVLKVRSPEDAIRAGIAMVPENRKEEGLVLNMNVGENICLGSKVIKPIRQKSTEVKTAQEYIELLRVKCYSHKQKIMNLSGGNQQKAVISKCLLHNAKVLILDEPTRGIDVGSKSEIYALIGKLVQQNVAVILISSEFDEIQGLCDRAIVLYEGANMGELARKDITNERVLAMSHGQKIDIAH